MFAVSKVAAVWFSENQRVTANTVISISNPLGIFGAFLIFPLLVETPNDIPKMLIVNVIPAGLIFYVIETKYEVIGRACLCWTL